VGLPSYPNFEFAIHQDDAWSDVSLAAGLAVRTHDGDGVTPDRTWGSDAVDTEDPDSWGHILAPEFHDLLVPVAVVGVIYFVARRRRRNADS